MNQDEAYQAEWVRLQQFTSRQGDPSVLSGLAYLTSQLQHRLDNNFSEFASRLVEKLVPSLVQPLPARAIIQTTHSGDDTAIKFQILPGMTQHLHYIDLPYLEQIQVLQDLKSYWVLPEVNYPIDYFVDYFHFPAQHAFVNCAAPPKDFFKKNCIAVENSYHFWCEPVKLTQEKLVYPLVVDAQSASIAIKKIVAIAELENTRYRLSQQLIKKKLWQYLELLESPQKFKQILSIEATVFDAEIPHQRLQPGMKCPLGCLLTQPSKPVLTTDLAVPFADVVLLLTHNPSDIVTKKHVDTALTLAARNNTDKLVPCLTALQNISAQWGFCVYHGVSFMRVEINIDLAELAFSHTAEAYYFSTVVYFYYKKILSPMIKVKLAVRCLPSCTYWVWSEP